MKKELILVSLLIAILFVIVGCCKDGEYRKDKKDYREKWMGNYMGEYIHWSYFGTASHGTETRDTINEYVINVSVWEDSCLLFKPTYYGAYPKVNIDGYFHHFLDRGVVKGILQNDSLFYLGSNRQGQGYSDGFEFKGKKL